MTGILTNIFISVCCKSKHIPHLRQVRGHIASIQSEYLEVLLHSVAAQFLHFGCLSTQAKNNQNLHGYKMWYSSFIFIQVLGKQGKAVQQILGRYRIPQNP